MRRTLVSGLTTQQARALVEHAATILSGDPEDHHSDLLAACDRIVDNFDQIVGDAIVDPEGEPEVGS